MHLEKIVFVQRLGNTIRKHRINKNYTIEKLAFITGLDYSHLSKIERGITNPTIYNLLVISAILEVPVCKLIEDPHCEREINF
jgi:transcriptional regulator with XRE-family HTH domain